MSESEINAIVDQKLLDILVCPIGLAELELQENSLVCTKCGTRYRIEEGGIPNMLIEDAELPAGISDYKELNCWKEREEAEEKTASSSE